MKKYRKYLFFFFISSFFQYKIHAIEFQIFPQDINPKIALVLSGGGSRGIAHIGVLKILDKGKIPISCISGTSVGALVGGLYCLGYTPEELEEIALTTNWSEVLSLKTEQDRSEYFFDQKIIKDRTFLSFRFNNFKFVYPKAISSGWKFNSFLQKLVWKGGIYSENFDSLRIPLRIVTTDIVTGNSHIFDRGNIVVALRASSTIPLINTPVEIDSMVLVDGGLFENLPVDPCFSFHPEIIIAVNTTTPPLTPQELSKPWNIANQVVSILMNKFIDNAIKKVDFLIQPTIGKKSNNDFTHLDSLIYAGEESTLKILPEIKERLEKEKVRLVDSIEQIIKKKFNLHDSLFIIFYGDIGAGYLVTKTEISKLNQNPNLTSFKIFLDSIADDPMIKKIILSDDVPSLEKESSKFKLKLTIEFYSKFDSIFIENGIGKFYEELNSIAKNFIGLPTNEKNKNDLSIQLTKFLAQKGYAFSKVSFSKIVEKENNIVKIIIQPNIIEDIIFRNISANNFIVQRELTIKKGDFINPDKIAQSWSNLLSTDLFTDLRIGFHQNPETLTSIITIEGQERGTQIINLPLRIDNERNLQGGIDFVQENLFNSGGRFIFSFLLGARNLFSKVELTQSRILNTQFTFSFETIFEKKGNYVFRKVLNLPINRFENETTDEIFTENYGFSIRFGSQIERLGNLFAKFRIQKQRYYFKREVIKPSFYPINNVQIGLVFDSRDKLDFPTKGRFINAFIEIPLNFPKEVVSFTRAYFSHINVFTFKDITFKPQVSFGFADLSTPFPEFFSLGGNESLIGFREDEFRGRQIFSAMLETRYRSPYKIYFDTYFTLHYGIGSAWSLFETIRIGDLKHSFGLSLSFDTPIGPANFSIGKGFYFLKKPYTIVWGPLRTFFSIGRRLF
ncbi:MAG: patatin-like phospholipase family protein [Candidatus Kapaibacteriales bacterium]